jgi:mannose-6-phosphate isomerase class I
MKNSDNVVRLGLTPKLKDIPTLLEIMNDTIDLDGINIH